MTDGEDRTITVTANEEVRIQPDMAEVVCGVTTEGADPETCRRENGAALALYRKFGFAEAGNADDEEIELAMRVNH